MLTERQAKILKAIVQEYINSKQPVGSKKIMELLDIKASSATIRNESVVLEEKGFLEKQHTSSGRIPSTIGYRFYVDNLMELHEEKELKKYLKNLLLNRGYTVDNIIEKASEIISEMTNMTAIVARKDNTTDIKLVKIDLVPISDSMASVIFVLSNATVHQKVFNLSNVSLNDLGISIKLFSDNLINTNIQEIKNVTNKIKPELKNKVIKYEFVLESFIETILQGNDSKKDIVGMQYMLENPEFNDTNKIKNIIHLLQSVSPFDWYEASYSNQKNLNMINTKIGNEISKDIDDIAIVGTEFKTTDGKVTSLTLVGPKRVDYLQANQLVNILIEIINREGEKDE
ncbi:heat-inducible transcriptional repressor HrcA [Mesoplasma photuris]|uniref:heat-inducible transcriptional repressor HrcA n=1 Tax=Mesoplasma photuris TaxID=217731 RepID=UPI0004E159F6|nr:heat-inducible transcriptional repressor HrcA [Mesoplasma photuris]